MISKGYLKLSSKVASIFLLVSCADKSSMKRGGSESKPVAISNPINNTQNQNTDNVVPTPIAKAVYEMEVFARYQQSNQIKLCNGEMNMIILHPISMKPSGSLDCAMLGKMDLSKMFPEPPTDFIKEDLKKLKAYGLVSRMPNPTDRRHEFRPPLPFLLGPVIQDHSVYKNFEFKESNIQLTTTNAQTGAPVSAKGSISFQIIDLKTSYAKSVSGVEGKLNNIIHYRRSATGFDDPAIKKTMYFLFDEFEIWFNSQPIVIPKMQLTAPISGLVGGGFIGSIGGAFLGPLTIVLTVKRHTVL